MAAISGIEPVAAPQGAPHREARDNRAPAEYGAAVTHQDMVREKMRVDPAALADKQRAAKRARSDDPRAQRMAQDKAAYDDTPQNRRGQYVDVET